MDNWILKRAMLTPDRVAVTDGSENYTYNDLLEITKKLGTQLSYLGAFAKKRIAILTNNTLMGYLMAMTLLLHGKTIVWLNKRLTDKELNQQLADADVDCCLQEDGLARPLSVRHSLTFDQVTNCSETKGTLIPAEFENNQVVSVMFTSGSTGRPKGVQQTVLNHYTSTISVTNNLGLSVNDEWLCAVPIFHISGFSIMMRGILLGVTVRLIDRFDAEKVAHVLREEPISWMSVVPAMLKPLVSLYEVDKVPYSKAFKGFILGGEKTSETLINRCHELGLTVIRSYGMTETCTQLVASGYEDVISRFQSVGKPFFSTQLSLSEDNSEILLKTSALTIGYLNQPALFQQKLTADGWYKTGDVGHFDDAHYLYVDGRLDNMIISGGEHVFPEEVERAYSDVSEIDEIAVTSEPDSKWGAVPVAYVVSHKTSIDVSRLKEFGRKRLAHYKVPKKFYQVEALPKTSTGKVRRFMLGRQDFNY